MEPREAGGRRNSHIKEEERGGGQERDTDSQTETQRQRDTVQHRMNALSLGDGVISKRVTFSKLCPSHRKKNDQVKWMTSLAVPEPARGQDQLPRGPKAFSFRCNLSPK